MGRLSSFIGCFYNGNVTVKEYSFKGNRMEIRSQAADEALKLVLNVVK